MPRDALPSYDAPVNIEADPTYVPKLLLADYGESGRAE
jgi:hypothetical protein